MSAYPGPGDESRPNGPKRHDHKRHDADIQGDFDDDTADCRNATRSELQARYEHLIAKLRKRGQ